MVELNKFEDALVNMGFVKNNVGCNIYDYKYNGLNMITIHHKTNCISLNLLLHFMMMVKCCAIILLEIVHKIIMIFQNYIDLNL